MKERRPPTVARALLGMLLPERYRDNQLGDLEEEFRTLGAESGWRFARRWYWKQTITSLYGSARLRLREQSNDTTGGGGMDRWLQDLRYSLRSLRKHPQHSLIAVLTLSLAIGVNTSIFSLVNQVLFIDLPIDEPEEVFWVWHVNPEAGSDIVPMSVTNFVDYREQTTSFESMGALVWSTMILTGGDQPRRVTVAAASAALGTVWGDTPTLGRFFAPGEDEPGAARVAMITHSMWENDFGSDPGVLGTTLRLDDLEYSVVGVTSPRAETGNLGRATIWIPLQLDASGETRHVRNAIITGRLRAGVSVGEAQAEGRAIGSRLAAEHPNVNGGWEIQVRTTNDSVLGDEASAIMVFLVITVGLVLLIACANVANLVLVRAAARMREVAVRSALGASRGRLLRQLLMENVVIALLAGGVGVGLAALLMRGLVSLTRGRQVLLTSADIDGRVLLFTLIVSLVAPLVFALLPSLASVRADLNAALRDGDRAGSSGRSARARNTLVVSQVALALSLMIVSGLMARSVIALQSLDLGIETDGVLSMVIDLPDTRYVAEDAGRFFAELEDRVTRLPGVQAVALSAGRPTIQPGNGRPIAIEGRPGNDDLGSLPTAFTDVVSTEYFDLLGVPTLAGRTFDERDRADAEPVALVSREAAERIWGDRDPIGSRVRIGSRPEAPWRTVVGVVGNVAGGSNLEDLDVPQVYVPMVQSPLTSMVVYVRSASSDTDVVAGFRGAVRELDPMQPIDDIRSMNDYLFDLNALGFALILLFSIFALFSLAMAAMGIYGVMSFMVSLRSREIGVRMALGAERTSVLRLILQGGGRLLLLGGVIGMALALFMSRFAASLLVGVEATDPVAFIGVPLILAAIALAANLMPALRASRIDPMHTLRGE